jgi:N-dimethylarginine dimethylaminohydrolase
MNFPFSHATGFVSSNPWMQELPRARRQPDFTRATIQFLELYRNLTADALVCLLPTPRGADLPDLVYTASLGMVLEHLPGRNTVVISNSASPTRRGEAPVVTRFFEDMGYDVHIPPAKFEGEAELKHLYDNVYVGGYGIRSEPEAYDWMERTFDMRIVKVRESEPNLFHLDCTVFPITRGHTLVCTELIAKKEIAKGHERHPRHGEGVFLRYL